MGLKDAIAAARTRAVATVGRHRTTIDKGIDKIGEAANTRTDGRHETRIRQGVDQARAGLDKIDPEGPAEERAAPR